MKNESQTGARAERSDLRNEPMQCTVSKESLSHLLYLTSTIVERKTTMPILAHVNLIVEGDSLSVLATDLEIGLRGSKKRENV